MRTDDLVAQTIRDNRLLFAKYINKDNVEFMARLGAVIDFDQRMEDAVLKKDNHLYMLNRTARDAAESLLLEHSREIEVKLKSKMK